MSNDSVLLKKNQEDVEISLTGVWSTTMVMEVLFHSLILPPYRVYMHSE